MTRVAQDDEMLTQINTANERLKSIGQEHVSDIKHLKEELKGNKKEVNEKFLQHLFSDFFKNNFQSWNKDQCPHRRRKEPWAETGKKIALAIKQRFVEEIAKWEKEHQIIKNT